MSIKTGKKGDSVLSIQNAMNVVLRFFEKNLQKQGEVIGVSKTENGWRIEIEVMEESEYMRKHGRNDLLAVYSVELNDNLDMIRYQRESTRERGKVILK